MPRAGRGKCRFQEKWTTDESKPIRKLWVREGKDAYSAYCLFCKKDIDIDISHSGIIAITCHEKRVKHQSFEKNLTTTDKGKKQTTLLTFRPDITESRPGASFHSQNNDNSNRPRVLVI